jgi:hypothetical protein
MQILKSYRPIDSEEYQNHKVFSELIQYIDFYESLSMSIFSFVTTGTNAILNMDTYMFTSIRGTIESIRLILKNGMINDAYALLRKYFDSAVINIYTNLYLEDHLSIENFIVDKINNWIKGQEQLPIYKTMLGYINKCEKVQDINLLISSNDRYKKIRDRCNNHTHYNFFYNMLLNDNEIHIGNSLKELNTLSVDIKDVFIFHLAYLFYFKGHYMTSSDYIDALECGVEPEFNSQYWVAPFIQKVFDDIISKDLPDIYNAIKEKTCMELS